MPPKTQATATPPPAETPATFEKGLEQLEQIVRELERGELALEESIALFEKGVSLSELCKKQLEDAETRVEILRTQGSAKRLASTPDATTKASGSNDIAMDPSASEANDDEDIPF